jgi:hypothetical protein
MSRSLTTYSKENSKRHKPSIFSKRQIYVVPAQISICRCGEIIPWGHKKKIHHSMCGEERPDISKLDSLRVGDSNPMYGRIQTEETKCRMSDGMRRYWEKRRNGVYGNKHKTYWRNKDKHKVRHRAYLKKVNPNWYHT